MAPDCGAEASQCHNVDFLRRLLWETRMADRWFPDPPGGIRAGFN
jgi:hypothetical protein